MKIAVSVSKTEKAKGQASPYYKALIAAGAKPEELQLMTAGEPVPKLDEIDGVLFTGGDDVDPAQYGERVQFESVKTDAARDAFELMLFDRALNHRMPILGICRGLQVINVRFGGTLYQDLDNQASPVLEHRQAARTEPTHSITVTDPDSQLGRALSGNCRVNSLHHQAVRRLGRGLKATAHSEDGLIEAVELADEYPFLLAVQWHPEEIVDRPEQRKILANFIEACRQTEKRRMAKSASR